MVYVDCLFVTDDDASLPQEISGPRFLATYNNRPTNVLQIAFIHAQIRITKQSHPILHMHFYGNTLIDLLPETLSLIALILSL